MLRRRVGSIWASKASVVCRAPAGSFSFAVSGTGTSAMETAVANLVGDGTRVLALVGGYFADRIAGMSERYGGAVTRLPYEWGRSVDPEAVRRALKETPADVVTVVHAETSTGVLNPVVGSLVLGDVVQVTNVKGLDAWVEIAPGQWTSARYMTPEA